MASPWSDAMGLFFASHFLDERSLFSIQSARGALGDGGVAGRVALRRCPGHASGLLRTRPEGWGQRSQGSASLSADVPLDAIIEHMFFSVKDSWRSFR
jgi:hypothetical protein